MPRSRPKRASGTMSGSTRFFTATALILMRAVAQLAAQSRSLRAPSVEIVAPRDLLNRSRSSVSRWTLMPPQAGVVERLGLVAPAERRWWSARGPRCLESRASFAISSARSLRTSGSPPVRRSLRTPSATATRTNRSISSKVRISSRGTNFTSVFRHAVEAADVAAVGDADAQVVVHAAESVDEGEHRNALAVPPASARWAGGRVA